MHITARIKKQLIVVFSLFLIGAAIYSNSTRGEFISDDYGSIVANYDVLSHPSIGEMWSTYNTRILGGFTFAFNYWLNKDNVLGYHIFNIVVHIFNSILLYFLIVQLFTTPRLKGSAISGHKYEVAFLASLIFISHPIQTQAVSYIVQRYTSLATLFFLASLLSFGKANLTNKRYFYALSFIFFILCMLTKELGLTLPIMLVIYTSFFWNFTKPKIRLFGIFLAGGITFILLILFTAITRIRHDLFTGLSTSHEPFIWQYFLTELNVIRTYLRMLFIPINQSLSYDYSISNGILDTKTTVSIFMLLSIACLALWFFKKNYRYMAFAILWFFITLSAPVSFAVLYAKNGAGLLYDHWLYLPMAGFALFIATAAYHVLGIKRAKILTGFIVIILCSLTFQRNKVWRTETGMWEDVVINNPKQIVNKFALGCAYQRKGEIKKAYNIYEKINVQYTKINPKNMPSAKRVYLSRTLNNLGLTSFYLGKDSESINNFERSIYIMPSNTQAYLNLGITYFNLKKYQESIKILDKASNLLKNNAYYYYYLGLAYKALGKTTKSKENLKKSLGLFQKFREEEKTEELKKILYDKK